jgi:hypothetical protein
MIQNEFHGCPSDEHAKKLQKHMAQHGDDHHGLSQLFSDPAFPSVLSFSDFLTRKRLNRQQAPSPH